MRTLEIYNYFGSQNTPHRCFKGGGAPDVKSLPPTPVRYSAEAAAAKRDIIERRRGASGRAASQVSSPGLASIMPDLETPTLKDKLA